MQLDVHTGVICAASRVLKAISAHEAVYIPGKLGPPLPPPGICGQPVLL